MGKCNESRGAPAVAEDDDLEEHSPARRHGRGRIWEHRGGEGSGAGEEEWKSRGPEAGVWGEAGGLGIPPGALGDPDPRRDWRAAVGRKERFRSVGAAFLFACWVRPFRHQLSGVSVTLLPCSVF